MNRWDTLHKLILNYCRIILNIFCPKTLLFIKVLRFTNFLIYYDLCIHIHWWPRSCVVQWVLLIFGYMWCGFHNIMWHCYRIQNLKINQKRGRKLQKNNRWDTLHTLIFNYYIYIYIYLLPKYVPKFGFERLH